MRFRCQTEEIISALSIVTRVLSARGTQSVLEGVYLKSDGDGLRLSCSDGNMSALARIPASVSEEVDVVLPGKLFLDVMRKMPSGLAEVSVNQNLIARVSCGAARMSIGGQAGDLFPALPIVSAESSLSLPQSILRDMISQTDFSIAVDDPRKVLNGAFLDINNGLARMVTLDGFRMSVRSFRINPEVPAFSAILPGRAVSEIQKLLDGGEDKMATLKAGDGQMVVDTGSVTFYSRLIDGEYIDYQKLIPKDFATRVIIEREPLLLCVERAALMAREAKTYMLRMEINQEGLVITSGTPTGEAYDEFDAEVEGNPLSICFNVQYLLDILRALPEEKARLMMNTNVSPCLVTPVSGEEYLYLILPVRAGSESRDRG